MCTVLVVGTRSNSYNTLCSALRCHEERPRYTSKVSVHFYWLHSSAHITKTYAVKGWHTAISGFNELSDNKFQAI